MLLLDAEETRIKQVSMFYHSRSTRHVKAQHLIAIVTHKLIENRIHVWQLQVLGFSKPQYSSMINMLILMVSSFLLAIMCNNYKCWALKCFSTLEWLNMLTCLILASSVLLASDSSMVDDLDFCFSFAFLWSLFPVL